MDNDIPTSAPKALLHVLRCTLEDIAKQRTTNNSLAMVSLVDKAINRTIVARFDGFRLRVQFSNNLCSNANVFLNTYNINRRGKRLPNVSADISVDMDWQWLDKVLDYSNVEVREVHLCTRDGAPALSAFVRDSGEVSHALWNQNSRLSKGLDEKTFVRSLLFFYEELRGSSYQRVPELGQPVPGESEKVGAYLASVVKNMAATSMANTMSSVKVRVDKDYLDIAASDDVLDVAFNGLVEATVEDVVRDMHVVGDVVLCEFTWASMGAVLDDRMRRGVPVLVDSMTLRTATGLPALRIEVHGESSRDVVKVIDSMQNSLTFGTAEDAIDFLRENLNLMVKRGFDETCRALVGDMFS